MGGKKTGRRLYTKHLSIYLSESEWQKLQQDLAGSNCWTVSEYGRKVLLKKPVTLFYRDEAVDALVNEAIALRKRLELLGAAAPGLQPALQEIKICLNKIFDHVSQHYTRKKGS